MMNKEQILDEFQRLRKQHNLVMFTIYDKPEDFPENFVVRLGVTTSGGYMQTRFHAIADSLDEIRKFVPLGLHRIERSASDPLAIVEVWF